MNKKAAGWATLLTCIVTCAITYGVAIRPVIKRRKTETFQSEASFLLSKMEEKQQQQSGGGSLRDNA